MGASSVSCWVDVCDPTGSELDSLAARFGLHELAVEDARHAHQRPKLERYGDTLLIVAKPAEYDDPSETIRIGELLIFVGRDFVISVRHGVATRVVQHAPGGDQQIDNVDSPAIVHKLLDEVVDGYLPIAQGLSVDIQEIEADVFSVDHTNPAARIYRLKRQVLDLIRNVEPLVGPLDDIVHGQVFIGNGAGAGDAGDAGADTRHQREDQDEYFRDIADHTRRLLSELQRDSALLSDILQANLAQVSVAQNDEMRRMSAWAAIFLVPSLLAGIWGMNFENMPESGWLFGYPMALGVMVAVSFGLWLQFRRIGWLGPR